MRVTKTNVRVTYTEYNANPRNKRVGDCVVRALSKALSQSWEETYVGICVQGYVLKDLPSANAVWGQYLRNKGFTRHTLPDNYVSNYTVADFAHDHPHGTYILAIDGHVVCVQDGVIYDSWDSSQEIPIYYWAKITEDR